MPPVKKKYSRSHKAMLARQRRSREIRDLYNKLKKKYVYTLVLDFFERNYFIQEHTLMEVVKRADKKPVDMENASIIYTQAMRDNYNI